MLNSRTALLETAGVFGNILETAINNEADSSYLGIVWRFYDPATGLPKRGGFVRDYQTEDRRVLLIDGHDDAPIDLTTAKLGTLSRPRLRQTPTRGRLLSSKTY